MAEVENTLTIIETIALRRAAVILASLAQKYDHEQNRRETMTLANVVARAAAIFERQHYAEGADYDYTTNDCERV